MQRRHVIIAGGVLAVVIVAGGALAWLLAPEAASASSFSRAIDAHLTADEAARDKLLCLTNLPYQKEEIRVASYDSSTRQWLDILVRSGLYAAPVEQSSGGWLAQPQFVYALAAPGKAALRGDKLCVAKGVKVAKVSGYEQVREMGGQQVAMATAKLALTDEAAWFSAIAGPRTDPATLAARRPGSGIAAGAGRQAMASHRPRATAAGRHGHGRRPCARRPARRERACWTS